MNVDQSAHPAEAGEAQLRRAWAKPSLARLRSGSAENTPGSAINDGSLETVGS